MKSSPIALKLELKKLIANNTGRPASLQIDPNKFSFRFKITFDELTGMFAGLGIGLSRFPDQQKSH